MLPSVDPRFTYLITPRPQNNNPCVSCTVVAPTAVAHKAHRELCTLGAPTKFPTPCHRSPFANNTCSQHHCCGCETIDHWVCTPRCPSYCARVWPGNGVHLFALNGRYLLIGSGVLSQIRKTSPCQSCRSCAAHCGSMTGTTYC
ncbi:uncharacterized protein CANTADRAFT_229682 [Suhomyces tanzawaensis NRRL Y-17324]|uniref:Uncharacterized protein n=1 Tax=Suhomyces tanzawaensis NRRL Y-17324 TaxID=984487 RepID=A0A1E4SLA5_9ASCO|nr:uncharacterized protein CANTADRAFT_229682 [Suhomyces tanzawaensis NRRL Y-17324]ODV80212.1 hypothetical protein CANTADRAFT_229682 [Suhomyces tanzawaensis NRRL Y-17324]